MVFITENTYFIKIKINKQIKMKSNGEYGKPECGFCRIEKVY